MINELRMAELLCARLCHDLTGPIGAVNNGAEFLAEEGFNMQNQAVELIVSSAFSAVTRLQYYRLAYGAVKEGGEADLSDKQKLAVDFFADSKVTLDWPDSHTEAAGVSVSLKMVRLLYNLIIVASSSLVRGGTISVRLGQEDGGAGSKWVAVNAQGAGLKWDVQADKMLSGDFTNSDLDPKNVQLGLTKRFADDLGATLLCSVNGEELSLKATIQAGNTK
jgi:histidine phosphotransferase ChpT